MTATEVMARRAIAASAPRTARDLVGRIHDRAHALLREQGIVSPLTVVYLRAKPGRDLTVTYVVRPRRRAGAQLLTARVPFVDDARADEIRWHRFPGDDGLAGLRGASAPVRGTALWSLLAAAAGAIAERTPDDTGHTPDEVMSVASTVIRYKPGDRCVLRYDVSYGDRRGASATTVSIFGKVFASPADAVDADRLAYALWSRSRSNRASGKRWCVAPLGVEPTSAVALTAAAGAGRPTQSGASVFRPAAIDEAKQRALLEATAQALADLHAMRVDQIGRRIVSSDVDALARRADEIAAFVPFYAPAVLRATGELAGALAGLAIDRGNETVTHGAFKPSQLIVEAASSRVYVVDFDGARIGDPARDLGYLCAYLRPAPLLAGRPGTSAWHEWATATVVDAYGQARRHAGVDPRTLDAVVQRAQLYEAAAVVKIVARRAHRLQSPRPAEVDALVRLIDAALERPPRMTGAQRRHRNAVTR